MPGKFGDTPNFSSESLCKTCRAAHITTGTRYDQAVVLCRFGGTEAIRMPQPVLTCSEYEDKTTTPLWEMEKIAWRFSTDNSRKNVGFMTPAQFKEAVKKGKEIDD